MANSCPVSQNSAPPDRGAVGADPAKCICSISTADIYGAHLTVRFLPRSATNEVFRISDALKAQIATSMTARRYFKL